MKKKIYFIPAGNWVKAKANGILRFTTKHKNDECFEDDGLISGQSPSPYCHYEHYELASYKDVMKGNPPIPKTNKQMKDIDQPAHPIEEWKENHDEDGGYRIHRAQSGMSIRQYACIHLLIPETGDEELDTLIKKAWKNRIAENALQGLCADAGNNNLIDTLSVPNNLGAWSILFADALINELEKQKP